MKVFYAALRYLRNWVGPSDGELPIAMLLQVDSKEMRPVIL